MKRIALTLALLLAMVLGLRADSKTLLTYEQLPAPAQVFLSTHFKGLTPNYILKETDLISVEYEVVYESGVEVEFKGDGEWKKVDCRRMPVPDAIVPAPIVNYAKTMFKTASVVEISRDFWGYEVELNNGIDLKFDSNFNLKEVDD